jgi:HSP20 family protein
MSPTIPTHRLPDYNCGTVAHIYWERQDLAVDPQLRQWLAGDAGPGAAGDCSPPLDVVETSAEIQLLIDLPGVSPTDVQIVFSQGTLIVAGRKTPSSCAHKEAAFHLAERSFGRFVRAVRLSGAFDAGRARASLDAGELCIVLPKIEERRGRDIRIAVDGA